MKVKYSDLFDRWTILLMKAEVDETAKLELSTYQVEILRSIADCPVGRMRDLFPAIVGIAMANAKIWGCEAAIRMECPKDPAAGGPAPDLREIGRRALEIRSYNKLRLKAKAEIDDIFGEFRDKKVDHASA